MHAWAVLDALAVTDFPDIRTKCAIQSEHGSILHIPREGGYLFRMYIDLGEVGAEDNGAVRSTTVEAAIAKANQILSPYTLDVRDVPRYTVYEVGHRLTSKFDDVPARGDGEAHAQGLHRRRRLPHAQRESGPGHERLPAGHVQPRLEAGAGTHRPQPEALLDTYSGERQEVAQKLIDFDREWSELMAKKPGELPRRNWPIST